MAVASPPVRDVPLIVEGLLVEAEQLHLDGAPPGEVDDRLVQARALLAGDPLAPELPLEWDRGQA